MILSGIYLLFYTKFRTNSQTKKLVEAHMMIYNLSLLYYNISINFNYCSSFKHFKKVLLGIFLWKSFFSYQIYKKQNKWNKRFLTNFKRNSFWIYALVAEVTGIFGCQEKHLCGILQNFALINRLQFQNSFVPFNTFYWKIMPTEFEILLK